MRFKTANEACSFAERGMVKTCEKQRPTSVGLILYFCALSKLVSDRSLVWIVYTLQHKPLETACAFDTSNNFRHIEDMTEWKGDDREPDDVVIEVDNGEEAGGEAKPEEKLAKLRGELKSCRAEKQEYMDGWQRAKADYVNLLKRIATDAKTSELKGKLRAVETLLPAFDALERAKEHGDVPEGFMAIARQIETAFAALGLEEVGKIGEKFNPAYHDALGQDTVEAHEDDDTITAILEKGWRVGDTVIRPAKVRVGHF